MRWVMWVVLGACMTPVMHFGAGKSRVEAQHDTLSDLLPASLAMDRVWTGAVATATIRVYADDQYRAQNLEWRKTFDGVLDYANAVLGPQVGVKLVADYREWSHHAPSATLEDHLRELGAADGGDGALCVVGLTSSLGLVSATFDQLGVAQLGGRFMMMRGYADVEERRAFGAAFPDLSSDERENAHVSRRIHKTTAVFLHELGHNLGVQHEQETDTIMNATYSHHAAAFTAQARSRMQTTLDYRLGRASELPPAQMAAHERARDHGRMVLRIEKSRFLLDGRDLDESELDIVFSTQAALDPEIELVIEHDRDVSREAISAAVERAKTMGLGRVTFK
jgi:hypothetical protein